MDPRWAQRHGGDVVAACRHKPTPISCASTPIHSQFCVVSPSAAWTDLYIGLLKTWPSLPLLACGGKPVLLPAPELVLRTGGSVLQQYLQMDNKVAGLAVNAAMGCSYSEDIPDPTRTSGFPRVTVAVKSSPLNSTSLCQFINLFCWVWRWQENHKLYYKLKLTGINGCLDW